MIESIIALLFLITGLAVVDIGASGKETGDALFRSGKQSEPVSRVVITRPPAVVRLVAPTFITFFRGAITEVTKIGSTPCVM